MAYNKKIWQDNVSDITAAELNRMEQGIYDNSLVVEAIKDKLNPTDTETYKTAELTEGQITDVIGVSDIVIKGQTSQDGEPTPDSPVDVNVVSGSNVINTSNKNILNLKKLYRASSNVTYNFQTTNSVSASGTTAYNSFVFFMENKIKNNNYTLSFKMKELGIASKKRVQIIGNNSQTTTGSTTIQNKSLGTLTINTEITDNVSFNSGSYDYIGLVFWNNDSGTALSTSTIWNITEMQLEQGSTSTPYESHQGKELPLDLPVENLFDKNNAEKYTGFTNGSDYKVAYNTATKSIIIPCKENTTYTVSKIKGGNYDRFNIASFKTKPTTGTIASNYVGDNSLTSLTITTGPNDTYIMVLYYHTSETVYSENDILDSIQLEQGSKANAYTPYGTDPIELCKVGDYQDYFYKDNNKWYLHKEVGKVVLDGTEDWLIESENTRFGYYPQSTGSISPTSTTGFCSQYGVYDRYAGTSNSFGVGTTSIRCYNDNNLSLAEFKTSLATNNLIIYFEATATNTEITDTTLKAQLEAIYNAPLYEQTNITQTNNDLPMVLDITACKDNINGIKAFIRK